MSKPFLVSHEVPVDFLYESREFNDYDYCLPHLLDQNEAYLEYFLDSKKSGRYIIMDNSLHELGKAYDSNRLLYWIKELEPNVFIVPDVWQNGFATMRNAKKWAEYRWEIGKIPPTVELMVVGQGSSFDELINCLHVMIEYYEYKKVAISYGASWYNNIMPHPNPYVGKMLGRIHTVSELRKKYWMKDIGVHLLGCALPQEFSYYTNPEFSFIKSIDTSNPIIHGLLGIEYDDHGLSSKSSIKIDTIEKTVNKDIIYRNVEKFNKLLTYAY